MRGAGVHGGARRNTNRVERRSGILVLTTTLVHVEPGGEQRARSHPPEQVCFILEGTGVMSVGAETLTVETGDCVFVSSDTPHGRYFSTAAPALDTSEPLSLWTLRSESEELGRQD